MVQRVEVVQEALVWYEGALGDEGRAVDEIRALLEDTVPMLQRGIGVRFFLVHFNQRKILRQRCPSSWIGPPVDRRR